MKKSFFIFFFLCLALLSEAQMRGTGRIVMLHPSLGNTITLNEKQKYGLFPEMADSYFEIAHLVVYNDTLYTTLFMFSDGTEFERSISKEQLTAYYAQVEKIAPAPPPLPPEEMAKISKRSDDKDLGEDLGVCLVNFLEVALELLAKH